MEPQKLACSAARFALHHVVVRHEAPDTRKIEVRELLAAAESKISISVDIWTSSNYLSFLGVVAHFVGKFYIGRLAALSAASEWLLAEP